MVNVNIVSRSTDDLSILGISSKRETGALTALRKSSSASTSLPEPLPAQLFHASQCRPTYTSLEHFLAKLILSQNGGRTAQAARAADGRPVPVRRRFSKCEPQDDRPAGLPLIPGRHLSTRFVHQYKARPRRMSKSPLRKPQDRIRRNACSGEADQVRLRARLYARHVEVHRRM